MAEESHDSAWYAKHRGLAIGGIDILSLTNEDIPVADIEAVFGPKLNKNGYRYDKNPEPQVVANVLELYRRVTGRKKVLNNQINLQFARGVVAWLKGGTLDWAEYAVHCNKYVANVRETKTQNREMKEQGTGPQQLLRMRKKAPRPPTATVRSALATVNPKLECKAGIMPSLLIPAARVVGGPQWQESEVSELKDFLKTLAAVLANAKLEIAVVEKQYAMDAAAFQVCKMHLEGREKVNLESEAQALNLKRELADLVGMASLVEDAVGFPDCIMRSVEVDTDLKHKVGQIDPYMSNQIADIQRQLDWAENSARVARIMLNTGEQDCEKAGKKLQASRDEVSARKKVVQDVAVQISCVEQQLERMTAGDGLSFYPMPIISNPHYVKPAHNSIEITDCPVCGHGFQFKDILVGSCGHTYHPACLNWHTQKSLLCRLQTCGKAFQEDWLLSMGVRRLDLSANGEQQLSRRKGWMHESCPKVHPMHGIKVVEQTVKEVQKEEQKMDTLAASVIDSVSYSIGQKEPTCQSSMGSKTAGNSPCTISPDTNSAARSNIPQTIESATCIVCNVNLADITFQGCGHSALCYVCVMNKPPMVCPKCSMKVNGWSRTCLSEVNSPSKKQRLPRPKEQITLNLSSAFDVGIVPQIDNPLVKSAVQVKSKALKMDIFGQKETVLEDDSQDSDSAGFLEPALMHYPPRPIIHRDAKFAFAGSFSSNSDGSDSDELIVPDSQEPIPTTDLATRTISTVLGKQTGESHVPITVKEEGEGRSSPCLDLQKRRRNPLEPNPGCEKRKTRGTDPMMVVEVSTKKARKSKKKKQEKVKSFNYWA